MALQEQSVAGREIAARRDTAGSLLGNRYELLDRLGAGGMGTVYRAVDRLSGEQLALKRVLGKAMQPPAEEVRLALAREFQALATLRHPHVIAVRDYGFDDAQQPFFTMELLPRASTIVEAGRWLTHREQLNLLLQLLAALVYIHRGQLIHRDLKPGNVLVSGGVVRVLDFGLSAMAGQATDASGTLHYMAPERLLGEPAGVASDLYAVGVVAYEMLVGWNPFAHAQNLVVAILQEPIDYSMAELPPPLVAWLQRMLARTPEQRYADAPAAIQALCAAASLPVPPESEATRNSFLQAAPFIGRDRELAQLQNALEGAQAGQGSAWLVAGESGIGKSRLLQELRTRALVGGAIVLRGQAALEGGGAYHLWREALRPLFLLAPPDNLEASVLQAIVPDVPRLLERSLPPAPLLDAHRAQQRLLSAAVNLLRRSAAQRPILLLLEDLHWADDNSLTLLRRLVRLSSGSRLLIVATYRPGERPELPQRLTRMVPLPLHRLAPAEVAALSESMLGTGGRTPNLVQFLLQETEGNTFFIVEVMRALAEETGRLEAVPQATLPQHIFPGGMQQVVQRRLQRMPAAFRPLLETAAIAGRLLDLPLLAHLEPQVDLEAWLTAGANAAVFEPVDGGLRWQFHHDKLREGLLAGLTAEDRRQRHARVAAAMETVYAGDQDGRLADLAHHFGQAGDREKQRAYLQAAAHYAEENFANETALASYTELAGLAPSATERSAALLGRGGVLFFLGRLEEAERDAQEGLALAMTAGADHNLPVKALFLLGRIQRGHGEYQKALEWLVQAEQHFKSGVEATAQADVLLEIGGAHYHMGEYGAAEAALLTSLEAARQTGDLRRMASALNTLGNVMFDQGDYGQTRHYYEQSLELSRTAGDRAKEANALSNLGILASYLEEPEMTRHYYEAALTIRREIGDLAGIGTSMNNLGILARDGGDYEQAIALYQEALRVAHELGDKRSIAYPLKNLGVVAFDLHRYNEALNYYQQSLAIRQEIGEKWGIASTLCSLGDVYAALDRPVEAAAYYAQSLRLHQEIGDQKQLTTNLLGLADAAARLGGEEGIRFAARLTGFVQGRSAVPGATVPAHWQENYQALLQLLETQLDGANWATQRQGGMALSEEEVMAAALDWQQSLATRPSEAMEGR